MTQALLTIDLDALASNHDFLARQAPAAKLAPVVKADGYGLGAAAAALRLHAEGARSFFVARVAEGEALRRAFGGREAEIFVLDGSPPGCAPRLQDADLIPVLSSLEQVDEWLAVAGKAPAALHIDTGMNRLGLRLEEAQSLAGDSSRSGRLRLVMVMSHLVSAEIADDPLNARQLAAFTEVRGLFPDARASFANSAGVFLGPEHHFDLLRPGITLYGGGPRGRPHPEVRAVARFEAPILQVRHALPGETVGYNGVFRVEQPMRIAILAAGYADGYLRAGCPRASAFIAGRRCPILGRISMDLIAVDVTDVDARPGELAQLFGPDLPLDEAAEAAGTIAYELLTRVSSRAERRYIGQAR